MSDLPKWLDPLAKTEATFEPRYNGPGMIVRSSEGKRRPSVLLQHVFVWDSMRMYMQLGCDEEQAAHVTANACVECASGAALKGRNAYGVKVKASNMKNRQWSEAAGHVKGGDAPVVRYVVFRTNLDGAKYWLETFVPLQPKDQTWTDTVDGAGDYRAAGLAFHRVGGRALPGWFDKIIEGQYKGDVTKNDPDQRARSIATFMALVQSTLALYHRPFCGSGLATQTILHALGYDVGALDGVVGTKTQAAIRAAQLIEGLPQTGAMDPMLGKSLLRKFLATLPALT